MIDVQGLLIKHRIPPTLLSKEVLADEEFLEEFAERGEVLFPFAFPGLIFRYTKGIAVDQEPLASALRSEYPNVRVISKDPLSFPPFRRVYVEAPPVHARDVVIRAALLDAEEIYGVGRESFVATLVSEPGLHGYTYVSAFIQTLYAVEDAYRLPSDAFYPVPSGPMGGFVLVKKRRISNPDRYLQFLKRLFTAKRKKLKNLGVEGGRRPWEMAPEELLEVFETTTR